MPLPEIEEILLRYKEEEKKIEVLLKEITARDEEIAKKEETTPRVLRFEEAKARNEKLVKDLEVVKVGENLPKIPRRTLTTRQNLAL